MQFMYRHGYAIPSNVAQEPRVPRGGTYTTKWMPRGTYDAAKPGFALGAVENDSDPINEFGVSVSKIVMRNLAAIPKRERASALEALFGRIDPMLYPRVQREAARRERQGHTPDRALRGAIAAAASQGLLEEFKRAGSGVMRPAAMGFFNPVSWVVGKGAKYGGRTASFLKETAGSIGGLACKVAGTDLGAAAAGAAGGPAAAGGAKTLGKLCTPQQQAVLQQQQQFPILPIALIGAAAVVAIVLIK